MGPFGKIEDSGGEEEISETLPTSPEDPEPSGVHGSIGRSEKPSDSDRVHMSRRGEAGKSVPPESSSPRMSSGLRGKGLERPKGDDSELTEVTHSIGRKPPSKIISSMGRRKYEALRPKSREAKTVSMEGVDVRQASTEHHQDGVAYSTETKTFVVCDGMGGIGSATESKDNFGFALAQAISEQPDIGILEQDDGVGLILERAIAILELMGIDVDGDLQTNMESRIVTSMGGGAAMASTVAAVQNIEGTNKWRVATLGDSSVVVVDESGKIKEGYGEAWQLITRGNTDRNGSADELPLSSFIGVNKKDGTPVVRYEARGLTSQFAEIDALSPGDRIVIVSDAYMQKSPPEVLIRDMNKTNEEWEASAQPSGGMYGDDASMIIIDPSRA
ncbi:MAG: hypothetical protein Q8P99_01215 [bacterium]|nr:hypothetical protein [bacterium]MDZ4231186.1 hypothetical protein [Patescibacteria group bacterium]